MKTKILSIIALLAVTLGLSACHDDVKPIITPENKTGQVRMSSLGIDINNAEKVIESQSAKKSRTNIDLSDYKVTILQGGTQVKQWRYADMPEIFTLPAGDYTVRVVSHEVKKAAWDEPLFIGQKDFTVINDDITDIGIVKCTLSNIKVTIVFDDSLRKKMGEDSKVTVVANDQGSLTYLPDETRAGYFEALEGSSTMVAEFSGTVGQNKETFRVTITDAQPGQHHIITFKLKKAEPTPPDETGTIIIDGEGFIIDTSVIDEDLSVSITINEDNITDDRPTFGGDEPGPGPGPGPDPGPGPEDKIKIESETLDFDKPNDPATVSTAIVTINSEDGIAHFLVKIETTSENFEAAVSDLMPTEFDLAYPGEYSEKFSGIGFPVNDEVIGAKSLTFDITTFVPPLAGFPGTHKFTLTVTDETGFSAIKSLTFVQP